MGLGNEVQSWTWNEETVGEEGALWGHQRFDQLKKYEQHKEHYFTWSLIKWKSMATCFILEWKIGFEHNWLAPMLSQ